MVETPRHLYGVIGDPVAHSLSPFMHQYWLKQAGLNDHYEAFTVKKGQLSSFMQAAEAMELAGFNVTFPHKRDIMDYLDVVDESAQLLKAVNTVKRSSGKWIGYNTDGEGFLNGIEARYSIDHLNVLLIGAGGAARAIALALTKKTTCELYITNRTLENAVSLIKDLGLRESTLWSLSEAEHNLEKIDFVINTTTAGFAEQSELLPINLTKLQSNAYVTDIIYKPLKTPFLRTAEQKGNQIMNGLPMLIHQGALAFKYWHDIMPDTQQMDYFLTHKLEGSYAE